MQQTTVHNSSQDQLTSEKTIQTAKVSVDIEQQQNNVGKSDSIEPTDNDQKQHKQEQNDQAIVSSSIEPPSVSEENKEQMVELATWAEQHKNKINDLITAHAPDAVAEHMVKKVSEDNDFLSAPELKQDLEQDENWAYNTEQELKTYINNHQFAEQFQLLNLSCKQLTCDILGIEKAPQAWLQIFFSMFSNINNLLPPDETKPTRSVSYMNGDNTSTIYYQLQFKSP